MGALLSPEANLGRLGLPRARGAAGVRGKARYRPAETWRVRPAVVGTGAARAGEGLRQKKKGGPRTKKSRLGGRVARRTMGAPPAPRLTPFFRQSSRPFA